MRQCPIGQTIRPRRLTSPSRRRGLPHLAAKIARATHGIDLIALVRRVDSYVHEAEPEAAVKRAAELRQLARAPRLKGTTNREPRRPPKPGVLTLMQHRRNARPRR